ncbi:hypothetical protein E4O02_03465 [Treponema sp. OMZ 791]|uniref:hypothetical protein n=1 Tax=Treponema sp. OMZ 791 TaxID=2563666 RepID=UPI0020A3F220|nr:hypothetical protein [Treponema sp. OMZ 791]UTC71258.1 hypothetical protein E4O02_03465 [Treponema sp. OMZ 791]
MTLGMVLTISIVAGVIVLLIRKYYRIFKVRLQLQLWRKKTSILRAAAVADAAAVLREKASFFLL